MFVQGRAETAPSHEEPTSTSRLTTHSKTCLCALSSLPPRTPSLVPEDGALEKLCVKEWLQRVGSHVVQGQRGRRRLSGDVRDVVGMVSTDLVSDEEIHVLMS